MADILDYKQILWDFDGVLMDSMPVRDQGFIHVLKDYPAEQVGALMKFHRLNGGLSRYVKFRYFFEEIRKEKITEEQVNSLAAEFSIVMMNLLINHELLIHDSLNFVKQYYQARPMHIVSGSDGKELNEICSRLNIAQYFVSIHGSPTPKNQLVANVLEMNSYAASDTVLVGDSINDLQAATVNNIDFIGYNNVEFVKDGVLYIHSFHALTT